MKRSCRRSFPYSHADIHRVLKRVRETYCNAIGDDVLVFLDHYLNLIGTRFMNESAESERIDELCQRIYKNHRQALDLIYERVGTPTSGVLAEAEKVLEDDPRWEVVARPSRRFDLVPKAWLEWLPSLGLMADLRSWIYVRLRSDEGRFLYMVQMAPLTDPAKQNKIVADLRPKHSEFGFKPFKGNKKVKNIKCNIFAFQSILEWDEDKDPPEVEAIREAVKKTLDDLYPRLEKLALVLKPLCNSPASTT